MAELRTTRCTFAGNGFLQDTRGYVRDWLARFGRLDFDQIFRVQRMPVAQLRLGQFQHDSIDWLSLPYSSAPHPWLSELIWPSGATRFACGLFLIDWAALRDIATKCNMGSLPENPTENDWEYPTAGDSAETFLFLPEADEEGESGDIIHPHLSCQLWPLQPIRVNQSHEANLWILPLVDRRYRDGIHQFKPSVAKDSTWQDFVDQFEAVTGATVDGVDQLPAGYTPAVEVFNGRILPACQALDAAVLGAGCHVRLNPENDHYTITRAIDCRTNASNSLTLSNDREDADAIWLNTTPPRTMVMRPLQRNYVDGRAGMDLVTQTTVTDATMRVHQPPTSIMSSDGAYSNPFIGSLSGGSQAIWNGPIGHRAVWRGRMPTAWNLDRFDDFMRFDVTRGYVFEIRSLPREFAPLTVPLQIPGTVFIAEEDIRVRLVNAIDSGGSGLADIDYWGSSANWEPSGLQVNVREGLHHLAESIPGGTPCLAKHMGNGGWVIYQASRSC